MPLKTKSQKSSLLSVREKFGYGMGDFAFDLFFMFFIYYAMFFYTDVFGIPAEVAATMFLLTRLWDAVNDPMMGIFADRTNTKWGKYRPFLVWMAIPYAVIGIATFTTPEFTMGWKIVYAYMFYTLISMVYTAANIPYSALMGVMTSSSKERTSLSTWRFGCAYAGGFVVSTLTIPLAGFYGGHSEDVITVQAMDDHKIEITEHGVGTVQVKGTFEVKQDKSLENVGWTEIFSKPLKVYHDIAGTEYQETINKETTIWVKSKASLLNQMFYEKKSRAKTMKAIINLDSTIVIGAIEKHHPQVIADAKLSKPYDVEKLGAALAELPAEDLEALILPLKLGDTKEMELEVDGNYYLASGFGKKILDIKEMWDDTKPSHDVWASPEKINWNIAALSFDVVDTQKGFQRTIATYAIIAIFVLLFTFLSTKERVHPPKDQKADIRRDLRIVLTNRNWLVVSIMSLFTLGFVCIYGAAVMYYFKYYIGSLGLAAAFLGIGTATNFIGAISTPFLTKLIGSKKRLYFTSAMLMTSIYFLYYLPTPDSIVFLFLLSGFGGFASGPLSPVIWAMYADIADHVEWKDKVRATGLVFSAASFAQKSGWALGAAVTGWLLSWWGFEAHIEQSAATIFGMKSLISWIPASCAIVAGSLVLLYQLDDKTMETIEKDLKIRRAEAATATEAVTATEEA